MPANQGQRKEEHQAYGEGFEGSERPLAALVKIPIHRKFRKGGQGYEGPTKKLLPAGHILRRLIAKHGLDTNVGDQLFRSHLHNLVKNDFYSNYRSRPQH
jgi:hypothetical protein